MEAMVFNILLNKRIRISLFLIKSFKISNRILYIRIINPIDIILKNSYLYLNLYLRKE